MPLDAPLVLDWTRSGREFHLTRIDKSKFDDWGEQQVREWLFQSPEWITSITVNGISGKTLFVAKMEPNDT